MDPNQFDEARTLEAGSELIVADQDTELLRYAPPYARLQAAMAFSKARELQSSGVLRSGIYYVVLVDLVGSTTFMARHGNQQADERIEAFISRSIEALTDVPLKNVSIFIKEIGDAALFCFSHFPDVLLWHSALAARLKRDRPDIEIRTCVHIGEVYLNGVNPLALAVSQLFKMEKAIEGGTLGLTGPSFHVAWPSVPYPELTFKPSGAVELPGYLDEVPLVVVDLDFLDKHRVSEPAGES